LIAVVSLVLLPIVVLGVAVAVAVAIACGCCKQEIVICNPLCVRRKLDNLIWLKSLVSVAAVWLAIVGVAGQWSYRNGGPAASETSFPHIECSCHSHN